MNEKNISDDVSLHNSFPQRKFYLKGTLSYWHL